MNSVLMTRYGSIPNKELIDILVPQQPSVRLRDYISSLYDPLFDDCTIPLSAKMKNGKTILIKSKSKLTLNKIQWVRAGSSPHYVTLPTRLDPRLAYLVGYLYGDGGLKDIRKTYNKVGKFEHKIIVGDEFEVQIMRIKRLFKELFNLDLPIRNRLNSGERLYYLNPTCKAIYRFLVKLFEFPEGPKKNLKIPHLIQIAKPKLKQWFLRGFVDADGDVRATEFYLHRALPTPRIKVKLADKRLICELKKCLNTEFHLRLTGPYSDTGHDWYIQGGKTSLISAYKQSLFTHPIKMWRLRKYLGR